MICAWRRELLLLSPLLFLRYSILGDECRSLEQLCPGSVSDRSRVFNISLTCNSSDISVDLNRWSEHYSLLDLQIKCESSTDRICAPIFEEHYQTKMDKFPYVQRNPLLNTSLSHECNLFGCYEDRRDISTVYHFNKATCDFAPEISPSTQASPSTHEPANSASTSSTDLTSTSILSIRVQQSEGHSRPLIITTITITAMIVTAVLCSILITCWLLLRKRSNSRNHYAMKGMALSSTDIVDINVLDPKFTGVSLAESLQSLHLCLYDMVGEQYLPTDTSKTCMVTHSSNLPGHENSSKYYSNTTVAGDNIFTGLPITESKDIGYYRSSYDNANEQLQIADAASDLVADESDLFIEESNDKQSVASYSQSSNCRNDVILPQDN